MEHLFTKKRMHFFLLSVLFTFLMGSCNKKTDDTPDPVSSEGYKYLMALSLPTTESYPFHILKDLKEGTADIDQSQEIPGLPNNVPVTGKNGFVYLNSEQKLTKYKVSNTGILEDQGSVQNLGISGGPVFEFLDDNKLLISSGPRANASGVFNYQIIDISNMNEVSNGSLTLQVDTNSTAIPSSYILKEGKIFIPYIHTNQDYVAYDKAPVAVFDASTMTFEKTIYTDKTASLGYSVVSSHGFSENGDLYIASCNSDYWGANENLPSGIVRIKAGASDFDNEYFFNLTEKLNGNHTGGMIYAGNNNSIVQVFRKDLVKEYKDYQNAFVIEYYLANLETQTVQKLNIPLCKYPRRAMVKLKDGKVAIVGNTQSDGNLIYIVDPASGDVQQGLKYQGTEYIEALLSFE